MERTAKGKSWDKLIVVAFGIAALILAVVSVISYRSTKHLIMTETWVGQTEGALDQVDALLQEILEVESAARGYVMSGKDFYLDPYFRATKQIDQTFRDLQEVTADDTALQARILSLREPLLRKISYHQRQIEVRSTAGFNAASAVFGTGEGHELMDQIRSLADSIKTSERQILHQRQEEARSAAQVSLYSLIVGSVLSCAILLAAYYNLSKEISRRKQSEANLIHLNRLHVVLTRVGQVVAQKQDRDKLLGEVCRIVVEYGLLKFAWVGFVNSESGLLQPARQYGKDDGALSKLLILVGEESSDDGGISRALVGGGYFICNDTQLNLFLADASIAWRSLAVFPLRIAGKLIGAIALHASEPEFFDSETISLLGQVASDLSFGLETIKVEAARRSAEKQIMQLNEELERRVLERTAQLGAVNSELALRNREIERADHLKSEFLANMSHELRTPLNAIIGFSDLMAEERAGPLQQKQKHFVEHIRTGAQHLLQLINDILDISKIEAGRIELDPETFKAAEASSEVLSVVTPLAVSKKIEVACRISRDTIVYADRIRFKQILYNLLSNAVKFTPEHGKVWIDAFEEDGGSVRFSISDTGMGIPPEEQQAIFDEFHQVGDTTQKIREGSGLGLAITKRLVHLHKGRIWLESEIEKGSTFFFTVPASTPTILAGAAADLVGPDGSEVGIKLISHGNSQAEERPARS